MLSSDVFIELSVHVFQNLMAICDVVSMKIFKTVRTNKFYLFFYAEMKRAKSAIADKTVDEMEE